MKTILYTLIFLAAVSFTANAQSKIVEMKQKNNFMMRMHQNQNLKSSNEKFRLKINPYWQDVNAPHLYNSYVPQVKVPCFNAVWAHVGFDSLGDNTKWFLRTADGGKTWRFDTIASPDGYVIGTVSPIDGNTCYASMFNEADINYYGGGIFKTTNGGASWKQLGVGQLFKDSTFIDFVYFFDALHGFTVGVIQKLAAGSYYIKIESGKETSTVKFIKE